MTTTANKGHKKKWRKTLINRRTGSLKQRQYRWFLVVSDSCDPVDCSLPVSSVGGILLAGILEWVAVSFSSGSF